MNAAKDSSELVAQLRSRHALSQRTSEPTASSHPPHPQQQQPQQQPKQTPPNSSPAPPPQQRGNGSSNGNNSGSSGAAPQAALDADAKALAKAKGYKNYGLDLSKGKVHDCLKAGVLEPSMSKVKQLKSAVEACVAIMRIDTLIKLDPEQRGGGGEDDGHGHM